jgi:hypothetical protein
MTERQIELTWRCSSCGATNLGRHGECQTCRNPKDGSETWDLPADTTAVPSVTDPALLELATGGPDWRCAFCGSDQRQADGSCRQCGAGKASAEPSASTKPPIVIRDTGCTWGCGSLLLLLLAVTALAGFGVFFALRPTPPPSIEPERVFGVREQEVDVVATAAGGRWAESVEVERLDFVAREGFLDEIPRGAIEVKPLGQRVRSVDTVQKGWTTETYEEEVPDGTRTRTVRETVDDGYDTRRTSERVQCGETCERGQETCREVCRPNGNGFATCRQQCTPGPQRCQPKYCNETRSERVPKTRTVSRAVEEPTTRTVERTRRVPVYEDVQRFAPAFSWKQRDWVLDRVEETSGEGFEVKRPVLPRGASQRLAGVRGTYTVELEASGDAGLSGRWAYTVPGASDFAEFAVGQTFRARLRGGQVIWVERLP